MTTRARRIPNANGLKNVPPSAKLKTPVKEEPDLSMFTAPPKDYVFMKDFDLSQANPLSNIRLDGFPNCCGASIAWNFYDVMTQSSNYREAALREINRRIKAQQRGMGMLIVNNNQIDYLRSDLEKDGWECVSASTNPVHANQTRIYLYVKVFGRPVEIPKSKSVAARH